MQGIRDAVMVTLVVAVLLVACSDTDEPEITSIDSSISEITVFRSVDRRSLDVFPGFLMTMGRDKPSV